MILWVLSGLLVTMVAALVYGSLRWRSATKVMHAGLEGARRPNSVRTFDPKELDGLPLPVQRYLRAALQDGAPMVSALSVAHAGTFNMSEAGERWMPFTSSQRVTIHPPGFDWEARIRMMPGVTVRVHDAYIAGEGILHATLFGLVTLAHTRGTPEVAEGELLRFLAESALYPTALLPSQGACWEDVDGTSARATLNDGGITVRMLFRFREDGLIESVRAEARGRTVGRAVVPTPWEGRWSRYELRDGMRIPLEGEVAWMLPEGPKPYWHGAINRIRYEYAP